MRQNDRLSEVLKTMKWEEPISRPKGRAREDVLIAALEDVLRETRNKTEADRKASEQVRHRTANLLRSVTRGCVLCLA